MRHRGQPVSPSLAETYFHWLYDQVCDIRDIDSPHSYMNVCWYMHQQVFAVYVSHDENRVSDASYLRNDFAKDLGNGRPMDVSDIMSPDATVLEVLIALARQADTMIPLMPKVWFQIFIENLNLWKWNDAYCSARPTWPISRIITTLNSRTYKPDGRGGIFPLTRPEHDQRTVELWYQMGAYMTDRRMY